MSILLVSSFFPFGSRESWLGPEIEELANTGKILLCPRSKGNELHDKYLLNSVELVNVKLFSIDIIFNFLQSFHLLWSYRILYNIFLQSSSLIDLLKRVAIIPKALYVANLLMGKNISHVHAYTTTNAASLAWIVAKIVGAKFSFTVHTSSQLNISFRSTYISLAVNSEFVRTISDKTNKDLEKFLENKFLKINTIRLGVKKMKEYYYCNNSILRKKIIVASVLESYKGVHLILEALKILKDNNVEICCDIYGDGSMKAKLQQMVIDMNLDSQVLFHGHVKHTMLMSIFANSAGACLVVSSDDSTGQEEGIPVTIMEALNNKLFVIATNNGAISEIVVNGSTGLLINQRDVESLSIALLKYINMDHNELNLFAAHGSQMIASHFNISRNSREFLNACSN